MSYRQSWLHHSCLFATSSIVREPLSTPFQLLFFTTQCSSINSLAGLFPTAFIVGFVSNCSHLPTTASPSAKKLSTTCVLSFCLLALIRVSVITPLQVSLHTLSVFASLCRFLLFLVCFLYFIHGSCRHATHTHTHT